MNKLIVFDLWTLKESYIKTIGKGLYTPLNSFSIKKESRTLISYKNIPKTFTLNNITLIQIISYLLVQQGMNFRKR